MSAVVTDNDFQKEVMEAKGVVVIDFWAVWCGPCRVQSPIIDRLAENYKDNPNVKFLKLDTDENPVTAEQYQILSIPTLIFFKDGQKVDTMIGLQSEERIKQKLAEIAG